MLRYRRGSVLYQFNALFDGSLSDEEISQIGQALNQAITDNSNVLTVNSQQAPVTNLQFAPSSNLNNLRKRHVVDQSSGVGQNCNSTFCSLVVNCGGMYSSNCTDVCCCLQSQ